jgi:RNA polymerase sigma factor (sigma-70 family)
MQATDDSALLREYAANASGDAFAVLVARHINLVYSVAFRQAGQAHEAQEITQAVFIILARKAGQLRHDRALASWLFQTTRLTANNFLRSERRRLIREQEAFMQSTLNESGNEVWPAIAPLLDTAVAGLSEKDRRAILLRFYEGRNMLEVGAALGASEDAAKKRVQRAVEKLRGFFARRGVVVPAAVLSAAISANSVQAAPAMLTKVVTATAFAKGATASALTLTLIKGALKIMAWSKMKTAIVAGVVVLLTTGAATMLIVHHQRAVAQEEIPRAAWKFAGYADPPSALMSFLFVAICQSDRTAFEASLSPGQQRVYRLVIKRNMELPQHLSEADVVADHFKRVSEGWQCRLTK